MDQYGPKENTATGATSKARSLTTDQYGPNENAATLVRSTTSEVRSRTSTSDQYGNQHGTTPPAIRTDMVHEGSGSHPTKSGNHYRHGGNPASETSFMVDAASARRSRLRYEVLLPAARSAEVAATTDAGEKETSQPKPGLAKPPTTYQSPEPSDRGEDPKPNDHLATSAAECVRSVLSPAARLKQTQSTSRREPTKNSGGEPLPGNPITKGEERNAKRLRESDANDRETLGECPRIMNSSYGDKVHLPGDAALFFWEPPCGPCDEFRPPAWFLEAIEAICAAPSEVPGKSPIQFEVSEAASAHNAEVLKSFNFDLGRLVQAFDSSTIGFGSDHSLDDTPTSPGSRHSSRKECSTSSKGN